MVTRNFPPMLGGMERLNFHIGEELAQGFEVLVVGPKGAENFCRAAGTVRTSPPLPVWRFLAQAFWQAMNLALGSRPHLIVAGSGVSAFPAVLVGRLTRIPVLTYLHGLDIIAPHPVYQRVFLPVIRRSNAWLVNSRYTRQAAVDAGIPAEKIHILHPGTELPDLAAVDGRRFRTRIDAGDRPILLSVGRLTRRKGLLEFIARALPAVVRQCPEVLLVVIGTDPTQSVGGAAESMSALLRQRAMALGLAANVRLLGSVDDETLAEAYAASQLHVFPVLDLPGDAEGFGMVAVEAAAYGVPTVAFAAGGVPDAVAPGVSGLLLQSGDYPGMTDAVLHFLRTRESIAETRTACRRHAERFAWPRFGEALRRICSATMTNP